MYRQGHRTAVRISKQTESALLGYIICKGYTNSDCLIPCFLCYLMQKKFRLMDPTSITGRGAVYNENIVGLNIFAPPPCPLILMGKKPELNTPHVLKSLLKKKKTYTKKQAIASRTRNSSFIQAVLQNFSV